MKFRSLRRKLSALVLFLIFTNAAVACCGLYVGKTSYQLVNRNSTIVLTNRDHKTTVTIIQDYRGGEQEFGWLLPIPGEVAAGDLHEIDGKIVEHLDQLTSPRVHDVFDQDPCGEKVALKSDNEAAERRSLALPMSGKRAAAQYSAAILTREQSSNPSAWLDAQGYQVDERDVAAMKSYASQGDRLMYIKVALKDPARLQFNLLPAIQISFRSDTISLPLKLSKGNSESVQHALIFVLSNGAPSAPSNYRVDRLESQPEIIFNEDKSILEVYANLLSNQLGFDKPGKMVMEFSGKAASCSDCSVPPLSRDELQALGGNGNDDSVVTRFRLRSIASQDQQDPVFAVDRALGDFTAIYTVRHPWTGSTECKAAQEYHASITQREESQEKKLEADEVPVVAARAAPEATPVWKSRLVSQEKPRPETTASPEYKAWAKKQFLPFLFEPHGD